MADEKWWGNGEKDNSKETVEEMIDHTEMMRIKREEEMAQAQHEFNMSKINQELLGTEAGDSTPATSATPTTPVRPTVQANKGTFDWMTDDPGYLFLTILVTIGFFGLIIGSIFTPSFEETWSFTEDGVVVEGTEWWEDEIEHEDCLYDEYYDEYYDCIYTYTYECGADVDYTFVSKGIEYFGEEDGYHLGEWDDYCLEEVENETLPLNSSVKVWYKLDDESTSTLEEPSDIQGVLTGIAFCCLLPLILGLMFFMYFEGNNDQYHETGGEGDVHIHHHHHGGGGILGGVYFGAPWHRRPWFHRRRSRRITSRKTGTRTSGGSRRSSGGSRRSSGGSRRSSGGSRRSGGGRRSR